VAKDSDTTIRFGAADARALLVWHVRHGRRYPWRLTSDPYRLVVTELMLVRTRADQVAAVWPRFFDSFPSLSSLAAASDADIREILRPLGLQWRATRIIDFAGAAAGHVDWLDRLPDLPGGGPYISAAAIVGVRKRGELPVDVTIARVIGRYWGLAASGEPRRSSDVLRAASSMGHRSLRFFHAWLDLAATVCRPRRPLCDYCPLLSCSYRADDAATRLSERAFNLASTLKLTIVKFRTLPYLLGEYRPGDRSLFILDGMSPAEEAMVWVHETCHIRLHPPTAGALNPTAVDHALPEEGLVHHAAAAVCAQHGVPGYRPKMLARGVSQESFPLDLPVGSESERDRLVADVEAALLRPDLSLAW
jgi:A/G-specific adenine glycosylase